MADPKEMKFDKRILERNLQGGTVSKEELAKHLESLPDRESNAEVIEFNTGGADGEEPASEEKPE